jgi:hypothetical protein
MADEEPVVKEVLETPAKSRWWIKNSEGNPSASLTFATVAFWVTTFAYIASIVTKVGPVEFRQFDVGACAAFMSPILALYFGRRFTEAKLLGK